MSLMLPPLRLASPALPHCVESEPVARHVLKAEFNLHTYDSFVLRFDLRIGLTLPFTVDTYL